jgi:Spy/CpxP family protein refolding chaperone
MKITYLISAIALSLALGSTKSILAQPANNGEMKKQESHKEMQNRHGGIPNLTDDQKTKIKALHLASFKVAEPLRNQLGELKAKQKTLATADKPDMKAIDANIDEITKVTNQLMKNRASFHQQVRALLNDEQKMWFDTHPMHKGHGMRDHEKGRMKHPDGEKKHNEGKANHQEGEMKSE